jgi:hypothetical protein
MNNSSSLDLSALKCIFNHAILPPIIQTDEADGNFIVSLAKLLQTSLDDFKALVPEEDGQAINDASLSMKAFKDCHDDKGYITRHKLSTNIKGLLELSGKCSFIWVTLV